MTELDVHEIICPAIERERDELRELQKYAEREVLELRRRIRQTDPDAPDPYDGNGWHDYLFPPVTA